MKLTSIQTNIFLSWQNILSDHLCNNCDIFFLSRPWFIQQSREFQTFRHNIAWRLERKHGQSLYGRVNKCITYNIICIKHELSIRKWSHSGIASKIWLHCFFLFLIGQLLQILPFHQLKLTSSLRRVNMNNPALIYVTHFDLSSQLRAHIQL